ncbi:flavin monooxygenase-like protein [Kockovaella imperatae]|uniref:Flavin monooxygenase-like protein n=1 Tax=Kockovaella imperatae TaxID=4999 RepID=A0A1Y1UEE1_9TREE|nr:flavin monooxygenase-like protein [Kockovaella imperatae]ORX35897.1 flavin monooxygenase-like protein [Kockovaella imperatae]
MNEVTRSRVAVIGLGVAGITSIKNLVEQGFVNVTGFERNGHIGGLWQYHDDPTQTTALKTTRTNGSKHYSAFQDFPWPDDAPHYPSADQVADYIRSYAKHFELEQYFRLSTTVLSLSPADRSGSIHDEDDDAARASSSRGDSPCRWELKYRDGSGEHEEIFDKVLVTNGPWGKAWVPFLPGQESFKGKIIHAQAYKGPELYKGKKVIVAGLGNSGADIAVSLVGRHQKYTSRIDQEHEWCLRRFQGRQSRPVDHQITRSRWIAGARLNELFPSFMTWLGSKATEILFKKTNPKYRDEWGFFPAPPLSAVPPAIQDDLIDCMADGKIHNLFGIKRFTPSGVITPSTRDGTEQLETNGDVIILATGYSADLSWCHDEASPFLDNAPEWDALTDEDHKVPYPSLYMNLFSPKSPESLAFIGPCRGFAPIEFTNFDLSSQAIGQVWKGAFPLPTLKERIEWCDDNYRANVLAGKRYRNVRPTMPPLKLERWLNDVIGNEVNERFGWGIQAWRFWWKERKLYQLIMNGINTPFVYRLWDGREGSRKKWAGARRAIYHANGLELDEKI